MKRKARRVWAGFRLEILECRALLAASTPVGAPPSLASSLIVRFEPNVTPAMVPALLAPLDARVYEAFPNGSDWISVGGSLSARVVASQLQAEPGVIYAEPDSTFHAAIIPNDPLYPQQWGLATPSAVDIDAPAAWDITTGNPSTIIAVLDSGIDTTHIEFAGRLWTNPADGTHGWNFIDNNADITDDNGHGTHVAGIIAATGDNGNGVAGVNWQAQIMPLKIIDASGNGSTDNAVSAVYWAVAHGARVINASWDGPSYSQALADAISYANSQGVVFVAAAGNEASNNDVVADYPADYRFANEISVAAVDASGNLASFSNYGAASVDLGAPGVNIVSTYPGGYQTLSGTSMAAPFVTGVASLILGLNPSLTAAQVVSLILSNTVPLPSLAGRTVTGGLLDAARAVAATPRPNPPPPNPITTTNYAEGIGPNAIIMFDPTTAEWSVIDLVDKQSWSAPFGAVGIDIPMPADYDGTGRLDFAVYRTTTAQWFIAGPQGGRMISFGAAGQDIPVPGDYDGDGKTDLAVFRPSTDQWFIRDSSSGAGQMFTFGGPGDIPVPGDYDGIGRDEIAVFRPSTAQWFILNPSTGAGHELAFGPAGLGIPVPGAFDGSGRTDPAVYEPANATWYILRTAMNNAIPITFPLSGNEVMAVPNDYLGVGVASPWMYDPGTSYWFVPNPNAPSGVGYFQFGTAPFSFPANLPIAYRYWMSLTGLQSEVGLTASAALAPAKAAAKAAVALASPAAPAPATLCLQGPTSAARAPHPPTDGSRDHPRVRDRAAHPRGWVYDKARAARSDVWRTLRISALAGS
jgi:subtilisin family serine protease